MDINLARSLLSVVVFAVFLGIVWWAYLPRRKRVQEQVALSILKEDQ